MKNVLNLTARELLRVALLLAMTFLATANASAADGDLDLTFDGDGKVTTDFNASDDIGTAVAIQADGKIVVAGVQVGNANTRFAVARYNPDGSLDTAFDGDGKVTTPIGFIAQARAVAIQADGKIVVAGTANSGTNDSNFAVVRYNADGTLDTTFGSTGIIITRFLIGIDEGAGAVAIQSDGKILVAGAASNINFFSSFAIARYNANGSLDNTFDGDGQLTTTFAVEAGAASVFIQSDGRITAAGGRNLARYSSSGALDSSFGTGGRVFINNLGISAAKIQPDGNIIVAGTTVVNSGSDFEVARLSPTGFFDTTFGTGGRVSTDFGTQDNGNALVLQTDGKIVVAGSVLNNQTADVALARFNTNGTLDTSFSGDGKVTTDIFATDAASGAALQPDGKIVVVGKAQDSSNATNNFAVVRYQSGGSSVAPRPHQFDFDGDGRDDISVYRPSVGTWFVQRSQAGFLNQQFGASEDLIAPADYDGDGKTDFAVFRPSTGTWFRINSLNNQFHATAFGQSGDLPRPGDYDGDGKADIAVFRPSNGTWFLLRSQAGFVGIQFGASGDVQVPADYDGDGRTDLTVYRPSTGTWFTSLNPATNYGAVQFGAVGDKPVPADYDGDGKTDLAVFRPSNGTWYLRQSTGGLTAAVFGFDTDIPVAADYDGDGKADISVFRPSDGFWYRSNSANNSFASVQWGTGGDQPVPAAYR